MWSAMGVIEDGWIMGNQVVLRSEGCHFDRGLAKEILRVVQPVAVEAAILASEEEARKQDEVLEALRRDLEAARYAAQRAQRQYDAADPLCFVATNVVSDRQVRRSSRSQHPRRPHNFQSRQPANLSD